MRQRKFCQNIKETVDCLVQLYPTAKRMCLAKKMVIIYRFSTFNWNFIEREFSQWQ